MRHPCARATTEGIGNFTLPNADRSATGPKGRAQTTRATSQDDPIKRKLSDFRNEEGCLNSGKMNLTPLFLSDVRPGNSRRRTNQHPCARTTTKGIGKFTFPVTDRGATGPKGRAQTPRATAQANTIRRSRNRAQNGGIESEKMNLAPFSCPLFTLRNSALVLSGNNEPDPSFAPSGALPLKIYRYFEDKFKPYK